MVELRIRLWRIHCGASDLRFRLQNDYATWQGEGPWGPVFRSFVVFLEIIQVKKLILLSLNVKHSSLLCRKPAALLCFCAMDSVSLRQGSCCHGIAEVAYTIDILIDPCDFPSLSRDLWPKKQWLVSQVGASQVLVGGWLVIRRGSTTRQLSKPGWLWDFSHNKSWCQTAKVCKGWSEVGKPAFFVCKERGIVFKKLFREIFLGRCLVFVCFLNTWFNAWSSRKWESTWSMPWSIDTHGC